MKETFTAPVAGRRPARIRSAVRIMLACMIGTFTVSVVMLATFPNLVRRLVWRFQRSMVSTKPKPAAFTAGLFLAPVSLIVVSGPFG